MLEAAARRGGNARWEKQKLMVVYFLPKRLAMEMTSSTLVGQFIFIVLGTFFWDEYKPGIYHVVITEQESFQKCV